MKNFTFLCLLAGLLILSIACSKNLTLPSAVVSTESTNTPTHTPSTTTASATPTYTPVNNASPTATYTATCSSTAVIYSGLTYTNTSAPYISNENFSCMTLFQNKMLLLPGSSIEFQNNNFTGVFPGVISSTDGITWTEIASSTALGSLTNYSSVTLNNQLLVIGGGASQGSPPGAPNVWSSLDGINWNKISTIANMPNRANESLVNFNNKIWLVGGDSMVASGSGMFRVQNNDIWNSSDGITWNELTAQGPFGERSYNALIVFNNKMWVIGGASIQSCPALNSTDYYNDVWCSSDGINWTAATTNAAFSARTQPFVTVYNNQLLMIGGIDMNNQYINDAWSSNDGITWSPVANSPFVGSIQNGLANQQTINNYPFFWNFQNKIWGSESWTRNCSNPYYTEVLHN